MKRLLVHDQWDGLCEVEFYAKEWFIRGEKAINITAHGQGRWDLIKDYKSMVDLIVR